jgi:group I intron endonuclease
MRTQVRASRRKYHIIYKTTCLITNKWYVGMHSTDDLTDGYMGSGQQLRRSIKKYGKDQHKTEVLEFLPDRESLWKREEELVTKRLIEDKQCMNLAAGGQGKADRPLVTKESTAKKLSEASKRAVRTPEWKAKISAAHKGKKMSAEAVEKHRAAMTGYVWTREQIDKRKAGQLSSDKFKQRYRSLIIDGVIYQNAREACAALEIPGSTLNYRLNSQNWLSYRYADAVEKDPSSVAVRARGEYIRSSK